MFIQVCCKNAVVGCPSFAILCCRTVLGLVIGTFHRMVSGGFRDGCCCMDSGKIEKNCLDSKENAMSSHCANGSTDTFFMSVGILPDRI